MKLITFLATTILALSAHAFPMPKGNMQNVRLPRTFTANYDFEGIVGLDDCSGSIVQFEGAKDSDQALVLTNGHCYEGGMPDPGQVIVNQGSNRSFDVLNPAGKSLGSINATTVLYSTMTDTDITLYKTQQTYADIKTKFNVRPYTLSAAHPDLNASVQVLSGYWKRGYACNIELFVDTLKEADWTMKDSIRYSRPGCDTIPGTSGSPIVLAGSRTVIGINNTGNESGEECTMDNPCEVDSLGKITYVQGYAYGQQTYKIATCVNANLQFDTTTANCALPLPH